MQSKIEKWSLKEGVQINEKTSPYDLSPRTVPVPDSDPGIREPERYQWDAGSSSA